MEDDADESETLSSILSELESSHGCRDEESPLSESSILGLQSLLDAAPDNAVVVFWDRLAAGGLPASAILRPLSSSMEDSSPRLSLLAARAYLSLLLSPASPLFSLFTPLAFLSLLRSIRRSLKSLTLSSPASPELPLDASNGPSDRRRNGRKRKPPRPACRASTFPMDQASGVPDLLPRVLQLLDSVLCRVQLDGTADALKPLVETLSEILSSSSSHHGLQDLCFRVLYSLVSKPEHGDQTTSAAEVLRSLAPMLLSPVKSPSRASAIAFITKMLVPLGYENDAVRKALVYLPRFLSIKAPEKSEPRACAVDSIMEIVQAMQEEDRVGYAGFVVKMTQGKSQLRLLAVDLILSLLTSSPNSFVVKELPQYSNDNVWGVNCLRALIQRCSDSATAIRARALTNTAQLLGLLAVDSDSASHLWDLIGMGKVSFSDLLRSRCQDDKAAVRKAALLLVTKSIKLFGRPVEEVLLKILSSACSDPLVTIRKAAIIALSEACRIYPDGSVITQWLHSVPRLIVDNETSIQEDCENLFQELVLDRISRASNLNFEKDATSLESLFPEGLFDLLKGTCDSEVAICVRKICACLGKKKKIKVSVVRSLQNTIKISESLWLSTGKSIEKWTAPPGTWQLLSVVSLFTPKAVEWEFLHHHWHLLDKVIEEEHGKNNIDDGGEPNSFMWAGDRVHLLQTIANVSLELPPEPAAELACNLLDRLKNFNMNLSEVDAHVKALKTLCKRKATRAEEGDILVLKWVQQLLSKALEILDSYVTDVRESSKMDSFLTPQNRRKGTRDASISKLTFKAVTAAFTIGSSIIVCPSANIHGIVAVLHTIITSENSETKSRKLVGSTISFKELALPLYIQSWVTMGKMCLVDDKLAKRYIPLFVQELERSDNAALRNNIMVAMTDFCVRYTALVDCYIHKITISLRDSCEVVRRQTFILLSQLLQRDYVKWRGVLFLRFLLSLVDESAKIRHLADFLFGNILKAKAPLLAYNSFVEAIFFLNDCSIHSFNNETQGGLNNISQLFSIRGTDEKSRSQRMHIYLSLLRQMAPEHLLATSAKLCAEILAAASDGLLNIDDVAGLSVLRDALEILACKEMRIQPIRGSDSSEMDDEGGEGGGNINAARCRVVTQVAKKNLIQIAIPIFIELKQLLESKNSPLTGCLMECLRVLLKDYKSEIDEILVADKQLQKELLYDIQKYEAAKAKSTVAEAIANVQRSESYRSPLNGQNSAGIYTRVAENLGTQGKLASAVADAAAKAKVMSVLKEANRKTPTPLRAMNVPKLKDTQGSTGVLSSKRPQSVLESLRRRQSFESDEGD
ncbi:condensin-2 complex subunit D3-like [Zingiber officinale]|uniref:Condensin complex subunit 1 C-terminal domain-containing protein n=1 Tax=Zingiber officinale TaxID=94328 RepID=A0A8J5CXX3_ZINOF|nr:condensin-2 complex subunit D3-like [Zingiber officinale]KAG6474188.1 hypothetical protein ZIOFF_068112 [Zingiber officinale]